MPARRSTIAATCSEAIFDRATGELFPSPENAARGFDRVKPLERGPYVEEPTSINRHIPIAQQVGWHHVFLAARQRHSCLGLAIFRSRQVAVPGTYSPEDQ